MGIAIRMGTVAQLLDMRLLEGEPYHEIKRECALRDLARLVLSTPRLRLPLCDSHVGQLGPPTEASSANFRAREEQRAGGEVVRRGPRPTIFVFPAHAPHSHVRRPSFQFVVCGGPFFKSARTHDPSQEIPPTTSPHQFGHPIRGTTHPGAWGADGVR